MEKLIVNLEKTVSAMQDEIVNQYGDSMNVKPIRIVQDMKRSVQEIKQFLKEIQS